jgi:hypothetical protein
VLARIAVRVQRLLVRRGLGPGAADLFPTDPVVEESPALAGISSASIQGRIALGPYVSYALPGGKGCTWGARPTPAVWEERRLPRRCFMSLYALPRPVKSAVEHPTVLREARLRALLEIRGLHP